MYQTLFSTRPEMPFKKTSIPIQNLRKVAAVIVTCNRLDMLKNSLNKTLSQRFDYIIVINNMSNDGTKEWLESLNDSRLHCLHEVVNHGGAGGFARGMDYAAHQTACEWIVCFDDDAWPQDTALSNFHSLNLPSNIGGVASAVYFPNGSICSMNRPGINPFVSFFKIFILLIKGKNRFSVDDSVYYNNNEKFIDYSSFVGFFVRSDLVRGKLGTPQSDLFIYADDTIYTWKLRCLGWNLLFVPSVKFWHDCKSTLNFTNNRWKIYYFVRNTIIFYKQISGWLFFPFFPFLLIKIIILYRKTPNIRKIIIVAIKDGLCCDTTRKHKEIMAMT